jgi:hypothetical protein
MASSPSISITRPNDTTAYTALDVIGTATGSTAAKEFVDIAPVGQAFTVVSTELEIDAASVIASETSYSLYLYSVTPPSALGDNTVWDLPSGDRASFLGSIALGTPVDIGSTLYVRQNNVQAMFKPTGSSVFAYLSTTAGYTPTALRVYKVTLHTVLA